MFKNIPSVVLAIVLILSLSACSVGDDVAVYSQITVSNANTGSTQSQAAAESNTASDNSSVPDESSKAVASPSASSNASSKAESAPSVYTVSSFKTQSSDWRLIMANRNNIISNYKPNVKQFDRQYCQNEVKYYFDERAFDDAMDMILAAREDGVTLVILSTYRTYARQTELYNNKVKYYLDKGYSKASAEQQASTVVAIPGTSDHNLGLAIDFNYLDEKYENKPSLKWLRENGSNYGFVMRYPKGKENVTGVIYEPWHYRYVGVEHAKKMNELGMCLEEYVEYLSKNS